MAHCMGYGVIYFIIYDAYYIKNEERSFIFVARDYGEILSYIPQQRKLQPPHFYHNPLTQVKNAPQIFPNHTRLEPLAGVGPRACDTLNGQRLGTKRRAWYR